MVKQAVGPTQGSAVQKVKLTKKKKKTMQERGKVLGYLLHGSKKDTEI